MAGPCPADTLADMRQNDELPWVPRNPMPYRDQMKALRSFNAGFEMFRDSGGPVTRVKLGPRWLMPELVVTTSPQGGRDVLGRPDTFVDKTMLHREMRHVLGGNLFDLMHDEWLPRRRALQPLFTKKHVRGLRRAHGAGRACGGGYLGGGPAPRSRRSNAAG